MYGFIQQVQVKRPRGAEAEDTRLKGPQRSFARCAPVLSVCTPPSSQCSLGS